jgi:hypothetical protein
MTKGAFWSGCSRLKLNHKERRCHSGLLQAPDYKAALLGDRSVPDFDAANLKAPKKFNIQLLQRITYDKFEDSNKGVKGGWKSKKKLVLDKHTRRFMPLNAVINSFGNIIKPGGKIGYQLFIKPLDHHTELKFNLEIVNKAGIVFQQSNSISTAELKMENWSVIETSFVLPASFSRSDTIKGYVHLLNGNKISIDNLKIGTF